MTGVVLTIFAASTYAVGHVIAATLVPALPRIVGLLLGTQSMENDNGGL